MEDFEEKERVWERMREAAKRRSQGAFFKSVEEKSAEKEGLNEQLGRE